MNARIIPLIMCGGAGTRLWPASREVHPKQFLPLFGARSTFQDTLLRVSNADLGDSAECQPAHTIETHGDCQGSGEDPCPESVSKPTVGHQKCKGPVSRFKETFGDWSAFKIVRVE